VRSHSFLLAAVLFMSHTSLKTAFLIDTVFGSYPPTTHVWNMSPFWLNVIKASNGCVTVPWRHGMVCSIREYTLSTLRSVAFWAEIGYKGTLVDMEPAIVMSPGNSCARLYRKATQTCYVLIGVLKWQLQLAAEGLGRITRGQHSTTGTASRTKKNQCHGREIILNFK